jgi:filamentous hemagglutinin family protein
MPKEKKALRYLLLAGTALTALPLAAEELPTGGKVVHGAVGISTPGAGRMAIRQSTNSAIVSWKGFSIGETARVDILQPSSSSAILNRVTGQTPSTIAGQLNANGQVFLVNPNGIAITPSGTVRAGAFVASTLDIRDEDFLARRHEFTGDGQSAAVANHGTVQIGPGGYAALLGGEVENTGTVSVPLGKIGLGAGEMMTLDVSGDGFLSVAVPSDGRAAEALIRNGGRLSADGGRIEISAATARQAARHAVNLSGVAEARTVSGRPGEIVLGGGAGGTVEVSGRIDASAPESLALAASPVPQERPQSGGAIEITGADVRLAGAALDAGGRDGGGLIRVGGDLKGGGELPRAATTSVDTATRISADAHRRGGGGRVIVWSDEFTTFDGQISARGGPEGGDGGFAEVSGRQRLAFAGGVDLRAPEGLAGTLLLDPFDILISNDPDQNIIDIGSGDSDFISVGAPSILNAGTLQGQLALSNVIVETGPGGDPAGGDITVAVPLTWASGNLLTLDADSDIFVNAPIIAQPFDTGEGLDGGDLVLDAAQFIFLSSDVSMDFGSINFVAGNEIVGLGNLSATSGNIDIAAAEANFGGHTITAPQASINVTTSGSATFGAISNFGGNLGITAGGNINLTDVEASFGDLQLATATGDITSTGTILADQADVLMDAGSSGGSDGGINLSVLNLGNSSFASLTAADDIDYAVLSSETTSPTIIAGGDINAGQTSTVNGIVTFSAGGDFTSTGVFTAGLGGFQVAADNILVNANMSARSIALNAGGNITSGAAIGTSTAGQVNMTASGGNISVAAISSLLSSSVNLGAPAGTVAFGSYTGSGIGGLTASAVNGITIGTVTTTGGGILDFTSSGFVTVGGPVTMQGAPAQLSLFGNSINILGPITIPDDLGTLLISSSGAIGTNAGGAIDVGSFFLSSGSWTQLQNPLPAFSAQDFFISSSGASFVRALGGNGSAGNPYLIADVYGLQGIDSEGFANASFALSGDIDASGTANWNDGLGFDPIGEPDLSATPFGGSFDGAGHVITGLTIDTGESGEPAGLFGITTAAAAIRNVALVNPSVTGFAEAGALVGINNGTIENAYAGAVGPSGNAVSGDEGVGGLVGVNGATGTITSASADIGVFGFAGVGGLVGINAGTISLAYAEGDVIGFDAVGGFAGTNLGTLAETYAVGSVSGGSSGGPGSTGGLVGAGNAAGVISSFWDVDTTGQTTSAGGLGLPTDVFQSAAAFVPIAAPLGWDFQNDWAPPNSYPVLYALEPVIFADAAELSVIYGTPVAALTLGQTFGGPDRFVFGPAGDTLDTSGVFTTPASPGGNVGLYPINVAGTVTSAGGVAYSVIPSAGSLQITPAPLTIRADDQIKLEGATFVFNGTEFTVQGLVAGDSVTSATLTSPGAAADAPLSGSPFPIFISDPQGSGLFVDGVSNYVITFVPGRLALVPNQQDAVITPAFFAPEFDLPNPGDQIVYGGPISGEPQGKADSIATAEETLAFLEGLSGNLEDSVEACRQSQPEAEDYLDCVGAALDQYATQIDAIALDLPEPLRGVSATIQQASREIAEARETAVRELATARTPADRTRIRRQALEKARASVARASTEIRKQIALIRADEPQLARLQQEQGDAITAALDTVGADLERAVGL